MNNSPEILEITRIKIVNPFCMESGKCYNAEIVDDYLAVTKFNSFSGDNGIVFLNREFRIV